jgi:PAS domain S-box-containing protein
MKPAAKVSALLSSPVGKIIVVDDEPELKNILVEALSAQGFEVSGCSSGQQVLEELRQKEFDLLLTDLMMPEMDGIALLEAALKVDPHLIGIMMTGQGTIQTAVDAMKLGAFDYVLKPFRLQTLLPVLTRAINTRRLRMENLQLRETVAIYSLCQTIAFTLDPQIVLSKLADAALQQSDADEVSILLPTSDGTELYVAAVRGEKRERLLGERIPLQESISSWVARERTPLILNGEVDDERFVALWPRPEIRSAVSVPMQVANKLVGIINLNVTSRLRPFTLGQMKALSILASTAAAALESASLHTQVRTTEEKYRSIFENATEGLFQSTSDGRLLTANPALARILGYDSPEETIATITDIAHQLYVNPEDRAEAGRLQEEAGSLVGFEMEAYRKDGEKIWLSVNRRSVRNQNGEELFFEGSVEDITARRHIEEEKRKTRQQYESLVHTIDGIVWELDVRTFTFTFVSRQSERLLGYSPEQWLSDPSFWKDHLHPDDRSWVLEFCRDATARRPNHEFDYRMIAADGRVVWLRDIVTVDRTDNEHPHLRGVMVDITERKRAEGEKAKLTAEIESQRQRLDNIVSTVPGVVWEAWGQPDAATQRINFVNDYVETMLGYTVEEWLSTPNFWLTIVHPDDKDEAARMAGESFVSGNTSPQEFRWVAKDGHAVWVESNYVVIKDDEGRPAGLRGVTIDITERKRAEEMQARRAAHASFRADVSAALALSGVPLPATLESCVKAMVQHLGAAFARIWTLNREEEMLELQASAGMYTHMDGPHSRVPVGSFKIGKIAQERAPHITNEVQTDPRVGDKEWARREGMVAFAGYPLIVEDRLLGVMALFSRYELPEDTLDALASVADLISQGIDRKRAEVALRESEERYRDLVENAHDIIYSHDLEGNYTSANKASERITGYTQEESLRLNLAQTIAPEYLGQAREMLARKLASEEITAYELELIAKGGHRVPVEVNTRLVFQDGVAVGVAGIARDITERKRAEAELRRLAAVVEQTADSIVITNIDGNIEYVNPAFERITGYSKKEVLGKNPRILKSEKNDAAIYRDLWATITRGDFWVGQLVNRKKDGTEFNERVTISAIHNDSGRIVNYIAVKQDTTHQVQLEEQLRQSQKLEAIGQLAGGVAHDFNNLLTVIGGYSSILLGKLPQESPYRASIEEIKKAGDRAGTLTRQLLAFSRKQILLPKVLDLNTVVTDLEKMLRRLIGEDIDLLTATSPRLGKVKADPGQIEQVLLNLIVNARDAMPKGGKLTIETSNVVLSEDYAQRHAAQPGPYVMLAVSDTGCGMDAAIQPHVFEPFFTTKGSGKGTGLGLATVYGIVKQSGGNIWVYSEVGRGSTFKIYLPRVDQAVESEEVIGKSIPQGTEMVLLVEDEDQVRAIVKQILEGQGYHVLAASNGEEALSISQDLTHDIKLMITDVVMPQMSGRELAEHVLAFRPSLPVLFMSGYTDDAIVRHGLLHEKLNFIQKPFDSVTVARKVREVLDFRP